MIQSLDDVFERYDRRKELETEKAEEGAAKARAEVAQGLIALRDRVVPAVRELEAAINARGHKAKVTEKLGEAYPSVSLEFTPAQRSKGPPFHVGSRISFTFFGGSMETRTEIALSPPQAASKVDLAELSVEWVNREALAMIAAALAKA